MVGVRNPEVGVGGEAGRGPEPQEKPRTRNPSPTSKTPRAPERPEGTTRVDRQRKRQGPPRGPGRSAPQAQHAAERPI